MSSPRNDRLIHWLLGSLELESTLFHLGQYCGSWKTSTSGLARAGFHVVLHGECWLHLPQEGVSHPLQSGDAVIFLRDVVHYLSPLADPLAAAQAPRRSMAPVDTSLPGSVALACGFFSFRSQLNRVFLGSFPDYVVISRSGEKLSETRPLFDLILTEAQAGGEEPSPLISRLVDLLFFYAIRHLCQRREVSDGLWALLARPEFAPLLEAIIADPGRDWTVQTMAELAHMSRATFFKRFAQACGASPSHLLLQIRMRVASQLIEEGLSLSRTAEKVGYQSDAAFSRAFKKSTGVLPGAYRRAQQQRQLQAA
ncbi:AraC family transcriptional regulator [Rhodocyclus tenuis]|uniref:AraC-like DNA-binding protein n=1 Tax=Rhodocyclus tenuis TaxID=1066 RepID=A0A840G9Q6_RHOTE|nr:AraC family transcriptional regulator [Rhodocyclus tenuis]MBB4248595.1 AraC-like DNA-binding protein [Rhodocyclus tenuis]